VGQERAGLPADRGLDGVLRHHVLAAGGIALRQLLLRRLRRSTSSTIWWIERRPPASAKEVRPFASGNLSVRAGLLLSLVLAALALVVAGPVGAIPLVLGYAALSSSYSFVLKEKALVDVFILASLYTIRIFSGGVVSGHAVTEWLIGFAIFMFLSLALSKRVAELIGTRARAGGQLSRRAYADQDIPILQVMGVAAAFVAALVLSLYLQSQAAHSLYLHPQWLLLVVVAVLFWFARVWLLTSRGHMDDDPVVWAVKDRQSQILGVIVAIAMVAAIGKF
jgi:4-hydroxybenzoate polyprenyltransferase